MSDNEYVGSRPLAVGMLPDGRSVSISEVATRNPLRGHDQPTHVAVDVGAGAGAPAVSYGFLTFDDAHRFVTSWGEADYTGYDANGRATVTTRHGLGCPDALLSKRGDPGGSAVVSDGQPIRIVSPNVTGGGASIGQSVPGSQPKTVAAGGSLPTMVTPVVTAAPTNAPERVTTGLTPETTPAPNVTLPADDGGPDTTLPGLQADAGDDSHTP